MAVEKNLKRTKKGTKGNPSESTKIHKKSEISTTIISKVIYIL